MEKEERIKVEEESVEVGELHFFCGAMTKVDVSGDMQLLKGIAAVLAGYCEYILRVPEK